jgi:DNA-binding XRE family transcriptional regulator
MAGGKVCQIVYLDRHNPQNIDRLCQKANDLANFAVFFNCFSSGMLLGHGGKMNSNKNKGANYLRIARKKRRLSQKHVARLLGHQSPAALSKYESGRPPPLVVAIKLAVVYQSSVEELFPGLHREIKVEVLKAQLTNARVSGGRLR